MKTVKEISITEIEGLRMGHASDQEARTGVTVLLFGEGARVGVDVSGGGPASRETPLASPLTADNPIHAIVLSGGSAFGLAASDGVMRYLEERGTGFETGYARVPLVCQSCIYDLGIGRSDIRPDAAMGYAACVDAESGGKGECGSVGAGTGATVGKLCGMARSMKAGLGIHAVEVGGLKMAAVVVVNALGDVTDPKNGQILAGLRSEDGSGFSGTCQEIYRMSCQREELAAAAANTNTTIGVVVTNAAFTKAQMNKLASMTRCAYARCINPVGTMADGDTIYAASVGEIPADINMAGALAAEVMAEAIVKAVRSGCEQ
ncbi:MAG: P1 family peptidase [Lachnospiraceae bacterium]|jgi:L-aminopeptidase/D-esterase-like protein|nr:P1 family peptidase [Lachnospiraceae bacterium]